MSDLELRKKIDSYLCNAVPGVNTITGNLDGIMQLVISNRESEVRKARMDELNKYVNRPEKKFDFYLKDRINQLTEAKEKENHE